MEETPVVSQPTSPVEEFISSEQQTARDQLAAAWQLHVEQIQERLQSGWHEHIETVVAERFRALRESFEQELERQLEAQRIIMDAESDARAARERAHSQRQLTERLNQFARRLELAEDFDAWKSALLDGASSVSRRVILFSLNDGQLRYEGHRSADETALEGLDELSLPLDEVPAAAGVVESLDTVIAMRTAGELSSRLADILGNSEEQRVCLTPLLAGRGEEKRRVIAILYAEGDGEPLDVNALELLASYSGATRECRVLAAQKVTAAKSGALMAIAPAAPTGVPVAVTPLPGPVPVPTTASRAEPDWSQLSREDQEVHLRAQRFARVRVAEMRLYQSQAVKEGRANRRLYLALRGEMDRSRTQFKHEFMHVQSMVDYFHLEVLRTLANDDPALLGPEYPGPLV